ncbi:hypothetical protein EJB05_55075, partial [Eragrostis curvula]
MAADTTVRSVWWDNFAAESAALSRVAPRAVHVAFNVQYPGCVVAAHGRATHYSSLTADESYGVVRANVNPLRPIQVGLAVRTDDGALHAWQFNLRDFDILTDAGVAGHRCSPASVASRGVDFYRLRYDGVDGYKLRVRYLLIRKTPVREGAALEELNAFLDLQVKLIFDALDERIAARDANRGALCAQSSARPSWGSGVLDAAVAQEVIPDLNLAAAATSATNAEPSDIDVGTPSSCSTECPNCAIDIFMPVPASIIATEFIPELDHVADATSAIYAEPCDINIDAITKCSTKCPSHTCEFMASAAAEELFADHVVTVATTSDSTSSFIGAPFTTSASNTFAMGSCFKLLEEMRQMELRLGRKLDVQYQIPSAAATSAISTFNEVNLDKEPVFNQGPIFDEEPNVLDDGPVFDEEPTVFDEGPIFDEDLFDGEEHTATCTFNKEVIPDIGLSAVYAIAEEPVTDAARVAVTCVGNNIAVQPVDAPNTMDLDVNHGHGYTAIAVLHIEGLFKDVPAPMEAAKVSPPKLSFGNELDTPLPEKCSIACLDHHHVVDVQASASTVSAALNFLHPGIMLYDWAIPWVLPVKCVDWQLWLSPMPFEILHDSIEIRPSPWPSFIIGVLVIRDFCWVWKPPWLLLACAVVQFVDYGEPDWQGAFSSRGIVVVMLDEGFSIKSFSVPKATILVLRQVAVTAWGLETVESYLSASEISVNTYDGLLLFSWPLCQVLLVYAQEMTLTVIEWYASTISTFSKDAGLKLHLHIFYSELRIWDGVCSQIVWLKWTFVVLEYLAVITIGRVDCHTCAGNHISFSSDAKKVMDHCTAMLLNHCWPLLKSHHQGVTLTLHTEDTCWNLIRDTSMVISVLTLAMLFSIHGLRIWILKQLKHGFSIAAWGQAAFQGEGNVRICTCSVEPWSGLLTLRWLLRDSGLIRACPEWATFAGAYHAAYLVKILTGERLPAELDAFMDLVQTKIGTQVYDVKLMAREHDQGYRGPLKVIAEQLGAVKTTEEAAAPGKEVAGEAAVLALQAFEVLKNKMGDGRDKYRRQLCGIQKF